MNSGLLYIANHISHLLPDTRCFGLKRFLYRCGGVKVGKNVRICSSVTILGSGQLRIGENTWIGHDALIIASADIDIGANVNIAPRVFVGTGTHQIDITGISIAGQGESMPIKIGDGSWICANSTLMAGVSVGKHSVVAAGAVVLQDVPDYELWAGVPACRKQSYYK